MVELDTSFIRKMGNADKIYRVRMGKNVGNADKLDVIKQLLHALVVQGKQNQTVRNYAIDILDENGVKLTNGNKPYLEMITAVQKHIQTKWRYVHDPSNIEQFPTGKHVVETKAEDCDGLSIGFSSIMGALGFPSGILLVDARGDGMLSHALGVVKLPMPKPVEVMNPFTGKKIIWDGNSWGAAELTRPMPFLWYPPKATVKIIVPG